MEAWPRARCVDRRTVLPNEAPQFTSAFINLRLCQITPPWRRNVIGMSWPYINGFGVDTSPASEGIAGLVDDGLYAKMFSRR